MRREDTAHLLQTLFERQPERTAEPPVELVVTLRKPDEFEALSDEIQRLRKENAELTRQLAGMRNMTGRVLGLEHRLKVAKRVLHQAGIDVPALHDS